VNCDWIAPHYWWIERLGMGSSLQQRRRWFLPELKNARRALVLGDGDGRFLHELLRENSTVRADYVDLSGRMLELARQRAGTERVTYKQADARAGDFAPREFDLIATHFFFDCFGPQELNCLVDRIAASARPGARWVVSEFRTPNFAATVVVRLLYLFFRLTTGLKTEQLSDHRPILEAHGFRRIATAPGCGGLLVSELWQRGSV
jgi:SAM-dependent methyltransferase